MSSSGPRGCSWTGRVLTAPELLPYIRTGIGQQPRRTGRWLLTGWQDFSLKAGVSESMAARAGAWQLAPVLIPPFAGALTASSGSCAFSCTASLPSNQHNAFVLELKSGTCVRFSGTVNAVAFLDAIPAGAQPATRPKTSACG